MNLSELNEHQINLYNKLVKIFDSTEQLNNWLSLPNKHFRGKAPLDMLLSGNYDYFNRFFESYNIE